MTASSKAVYDIKTGERICPDCQGDGDEECMECEGSGRAECFTCKGTGRVEDDRK